MDTKICPRCEETLPVEVFPWKGKAQKVRQSYCRPCILQYKKDHYRDNSDYYKKKAREGKKNYKERISSRLFDYLSTHPCVDCGMSDPRALEFDHVKGKGAGIHRMVSGQVPWERILDEISKCEVRCSNCHRIITIMRAGSHRASWADFLD
jgi:hypothetical protein